MSLKALPVVLITTLILSNVASGNGVTVLTDKKLAGKLSWNIVGKKDCTGTVSAQFLFHPTTSDSKTFTKILGAAPWSVDPNPVVLKSGGEIHGTTGTVTHDMTIEEKVYTDPLGRHYIFLRDAVTGTIVPGPAEKKRVKIKARGRDPFSFSDTHPDATFDFMAEGMELAFSMRTGTQFPSTFAPDLSSLDDPDDYPVMRMRARLTPGVVTDADALFDGSAPDAFDLYLVTVTSDFNHNLDVDVQFPTSHPDFTFDFRDSMGVAFDPADPLAVAQIESQIAAAFVGGELVTDLEDLFTVGFVPTGISEFTVGMGSETDLTDIELPEPSTGTVLALGVLMLRRSRR